jgi:hypothetical protein
MKRVMSIIITFFILYAAILAVPNDKSAVDFVKKIINLAVNGEQGYLNALRYFQYTATTAKNNPSSYILSPNGKSALAESGISVF